MGAIAANHSLEAGHSIGRNDLVVKFLKGTRRLNSPCPQTVLCWDLSMVIGAIKRPPIEPISSANLRPLSLKMALLLALPLVKHVGDLQALSFSTSCLEFGLNDCKVILKPRHGYVPKVLSTPFRAQVISLLGASRDRTLSALLGL